MSIVKVADLYKAYGSVTAVNGIDFEVQEGEIFTIIGPNGAGKTTTLEMMEGLVLPDRGEVSIKGMSWSGQGHKIKQIIGVQPQSSELYDLLTVGENLELFASFYQRNGNVEEIIELNNMGDHRNKRVKVLSGGQKQPSHRACPSE
jgi:ABC-2 type transport system ATP-binding protein